jgi:hypothetical protein
MLVLVIGLVVGFVGGASLMVWVSNRNQEIQARIDAEITKLSA